VNLGEMSTKKRDRWADDSDDEVAKPAKPAKQKEGKSKKKGIKEATALSVPPVLSDSAREHVEVGKPCHIPLLHGCRSVEVYERLNHIDEGTYGVVFRARDKETGEICAVKQVWQLLWDLPVLFLTASWGIHHVSGQIEHYCNH
jgi:cell division cycle 2-like